MKIGQDIIAKKAIWFAILANNESLLLKPYGANPQYKQKLSTYPRWTIQDVDMTEKSKILDLGSGMVAPPCI